MKDSLCRIFLSTLPLLFFGCAENTALVTSTYEKVQGKGTNKIDSLIFPYRDSLQEEMGQVLGTSPRGMVAKRPGSDLMNWIADAVFVNQTKLVRLSEPVICLLNTGGIRSTINKGEITLGDLFKLMPFDNQIVWVRMPSSSIPDIEEFIKKSGGEPLSNATIEHGKLKINGLNETHNSFYVITSDYLMNGGDKATFFSKKLEVNLTGKLMRDALIEEVKVQKELSVDTVCRITF
jgi:2',3'-cyclic-nucleotide 2'-phosphodiesterase (5'-nucleotidase family)